MQHQPFTILMHIALAVILAGALVTHFFCIQGSLTLHQDAASVNRFDKESGPGDGILPFQVGLKEAEIIYYPATTTPMDFRSLLLIDGTEVEVAMNRVGSYRGWRFYQSGMGAGASTLSVSYDPWGTGITYAGYLLLGLGMVGFFFQRNTPWRALLRKYRSGASTAFCLLLFFLCQAPSVSAAQSPGGVSVEMPGAALAAELPAMQRPLASNFGNVLVYWNDRICPVSTLAHDVTLKLYGAESYRGLTPEQVISGWLFYYDRWRRDYLQNHPELEALSSSSLSSSSSKAEKKVAERLALVEWLGTGEVFRIYPYRTVAGHMEWLSLTGRRPSGMSLEQWTFMQTTMPRIRQLLLAGKNIRANEELSLLMEGQRKYAIDAGLPSRARIRAERWYYAWVRPAVAAVVALCAGIGLLLLPFFGAFGRKLSRFVPGCSLAISLLLFLYIGAAMGVLWWISGHIPLSNGPETMMFMGLAAFAGAVLCRNLTLRGGLLAVSAVALFVTAMGGRTPQIGAMMPVLGSPLLSVHVMLVMIAYALFFLMTILSAIALTGKSYERSAQLSVLNRLLLAPAVCLLGAGIFIGAVWANQTWGRYWGWDPKETCALVMWLVYALPLHWGSRRLAIFRRPRALHIYLLAAILTVLFTYFGANYLLPGLHSYA